MSIFFCYSTLCMFILKISSIDSIGGRRAKIYFGKFSVELRTNYPFPHCIYSLTFLDVSLMHLFCSIQLTLSVQNVSRSPIPL